MVADGGFIVKISIVVNTITKISTILVNTITKISIKLVNRKQFYIFVLNLQL
jgi:hypothetical protein